MGENTANGTEATVVSANAGVRRAAAAKTGAGATGEPVYVRTVMHVHTRHRPDSRIQMPTPTLLSLFHDSFAIFSVVCLIFV